MIIQVNTPEIADADDLLDSGLVALTKEIAKVNADLLSHGLLGGQFGYGARFENDVFAMHPYCWCERRDCPWCAACECPARAYHYLVDGVEVGYSEWVEFYKREAGPFPSIKDFAGRDYGDWDDEWRPTDEQRAMLDAAYREHDARGKKANARRSELHDPVCEFCKAGGDPAPNFLHKPSGFKTWWYKWIGRDMKTDGAVDVSRMIAECIASVCR